MFLRILCSVILVLYPLIVFFALRSHCFGYAAIVLMVCALVRATLSKSKIDLAIAACAMLLGLCSFCFDPAFFLKLYPVLVNAVMLILFAFSLRTERPMIERFARLRYKDLPEAGITHCRSATRWWCCFFVVNGALALDSVLFRSDEWWTLYNGCISYVLIAVMFLVEWLVRRRTQRNS